MMELDGTQVAIEEIIRTYLPQVNEKFDLLKILASGVASGNLQGLVVRGAPGIGKTFTVLDHLRNKHVRKAKDPIRVKHMSGHITPLQTYEILKSHRDEKSIVVFDDCFTGDTKVSLMNGTEVSFENLVKNYSDKQFWVYSYDKSSDSIVPGLAHSPRLIKQLSSLVQITLDNGEKIKCTSDHKWMLRDGTYKEAQYLSKDESLMPLYRTKKDLFGGKEYEVIFHNDKEFPTHAISGVLTNSGICPQCNIELPEKKHCYRHHKDFNRFNNEPSNIQWVTREEHLKLHQEVASVNMSKLNSIQWKDKNHIEFMAGVTSKTGKINLTKYNKSEKHIQGLKDKWKDEKYRSTMITSERASAAGKASGSKIHYCSPCDRSFKGNAAISNHKKCIHPTNHKVISVDFLTETQDVYDITVDKYHNFALSSGVFVHNCDAVFEHQTSLNVLKAACDTGKFRRVSWLSSKDTDEAFDYDGGIIVLSNAEFKNEHFQAFIDRVHLYDMKISNNEKIAKIYDTSTKIGDVKPKIAREISEWLFQNERFIDYLSMRTFYKIAQLTKVAPTEWKKLAEVTVFRNLTA